MTQTIVHALDFDGVICDSAVETAMAGWKAAAQIWSGMPDNLPPDAIEQFKAVRPIIETGYEAILAMRLLFLGETAAAIYADYTNKTQALAKQSGTTVADLKTLFGTVRDRWIAEDLQNWIAMNPLFPGIKAKLQRLVQTGTCYVVTTKQERFVQYILAANEIDLAQTHIFGLDRNMNKPDVLLKLLQAHAGSTIVFTEDRLPALLTVAQHPGLNAVELCFADWGYNTAEDKASARDLGFTMPSLNDFLAG